MSEDRPVLNAATVLLLRDGAASLEVLYLRRNADLNFHGGAWVYPGGRVDPEDFASDPEDLASAAKRAAVREAREEAAVEVDPLDLVEFAEWTTPPVRPKRFRTWFFAAPARDTREVRIDGGEIHAFRWMQPKEALSAQASGEVDLPAPTFVTSHWLSAFDSAEAALAAFARWPVPRYHPRVVKVPGGTVSLLGEDAAHASGDLELDGPRHRVWMLKEGWRYERETGFGPDRQP